MRANRMKKKAKATKKKSGFLFPIIVCVICEKIRVAPSTSNQSRAIRHQQFFLSELIVRRAKKWKKNTMDMKGECSNCSVLVGVAVRCSRF
jgi:hypothetical protein